MSSLDLISKLAKDNSPAGRAALVSALTDLFLDSGENRPADLDAVFGEVALKLLPVLDLSAKQDLARRICETPDAPMDLLIRLTQEPVEISGSILEHSSILTADDLLGIANSASAAHLLAIGRRKDLRNDVVDRLIERGGLEVWMTLAANEEGTLDSGSLLNLVRKAGSVSDVQDVLIKREDLTDEAADALLGQLSKENLSAVKEFSDGNPLKKALLCAEAQGGGTETGLSDEARQFVNTLVDKIKSGGITLDAAVQHLSKTSKAEELAHLIAEFSGVRVGTVSQLISAKTDKPLIAICKAVGISADAYKQLVALRCRQLQLGGAELSASLQRFAAIDQNTADRLLEAMRESEDASNTGQVKTANAARKDVPFAVKVRR